MLKGLVRTCSCIRHRKVDVGGREADQHEDSRDAEDLTISDDRLCVLPLVLVGTGDMKPLSSDDMSRLRLVLMGDPVRG